MEATTQRNEREPSPGVKLYTDLKKTIENLPDSVPERKQKVLKDMFANLQDNVQRYIDSIDEGAISRLKEEDVDEHKRLEEVRQRAHNSLMETLKILHRVCEQEGLDISWKNINLSDRQSVQQWAQEVNNYIVRQQKEESN